MGRSVRVVAWMMVLSLLASACSFWPLDEPDAAEAAEGMRWFADEECASLSLARDRAEPLDPVAIDGWPEPAPGDHGVVVARILHDEDVDSAPMVTIPDWHETVALPAPVHPSNALTGGHLSVQIGQLDDDEARWCDELLDLEVTPLPPAGPDEGIHAQLQHVDEVVDLILEEHGTDARALAGRDRSGLPLELVPAYVLSVLLHDEDGLFSSVDTMTPDEQELADRLTAKVQRQAAADLPTAVELTSEGELMPATADPAKADAAAPATAATAVSASFAPPSSRQHGEVAPQLVSGPDGCTQTDFPGLTDLLGQQISGDTMAGGSTGFALDAAMFVGGLPVIGQVGLPTVLTAWATKFAAEYLQGTKPSLWEQSDFEHDPDELWEDDVDGGYVEAIQMRFTSEGWDFGPMLAELAVILAGVVGGGVLTRHLRKPRAGDPGVIEFWGELVWNNMEEMETVVAQAEMVAEVVGWIATEVIGRFVDVADLADDLQVFPPECWEARTERPDLDDSVRLHYLDAIERGASDEHFLAVQLGTGTIEGRWELPIGASLLGVGLSPEVRAATATFGASGEVEVRSLAITWDPSRRQVEPGEQVTLNVVVDNAHDGRIRITDSLGQIDQEVDAAGGHSLTYQVPADWDGTSIAITATSLSDTGLRDRSHPAYRGEVARTAWLVGDDDSMYLEPNVTCVQEDQTVQFEVTDAPLGGDPVDVTWSAEGGSITSDGAFTAASQPGEATVTATSMEDPDRQVSRTLTVGPCNECRWDLTIDGDLYDTSNVSASGSSMILFDVDWETGAFGYLELGDLDGDEGGRIVLVNDPATPTAATQRPMQVIQYPWHVRSIWEGIFIPKEEPQDLRNFLDESEAEIPAWDPQPAQARLEYSRVLADGLRTTMLEIPAHPTLPMDGEVSGPVVVGRRVTGTVDGRMRADTAGLVGEPLYGSVSVRLEGLFRPPFQDRLNRDFDLGAAQEASPGKPPEVSAWTRDYDTEADRAWCGGVQAETHDRYLEDEGSTTPLPQLPPPPGG